jgi:hypothetical protein
VASKEVVLEMFNNMFLNSLQKRFYRVEKHGTGFVNL